MRFPIISVDFFLYKFKQNFCEMFTTFNWISDCCIITSFPVSYIQICCILRVVRPAVIVGAAHCTYAWTRPSWLSWSGSPHKWVPQAETVACVWTAVSSRSVQTARSNRGQVSWPFPGREPSGERSSARCSCRIGCWRLGWSCSLWWPRWRRRRRRRSWKRLRLDAVVAALERLQFPWHLELVPSNNWI